MDYRPPRQMLVGDKKLRSGWAENGIMESPWGETEMLPPKLVIALTSVHRWESNSRHLTCQKYTLIQKKGRVWKIASKTY
ncbi:hypothetical protein ACTXT7_001402 [Hymenolepis weldensis]